MRADIGRAIAMATGGVLAFVPVEWALTIWAYAGSTAFPSKLRLLALAATLGGLLWCALVGALIAVLVLARGLVPRRNWRGLFVAAPVADGMRPGVPKLWATLATGLAVLVTVQRAGAWALVTYKEPQLTAGVIAAVAMLAAVVAVPLRRALCTATSLGAEALGPLGVLNPLARWRAAGVALFGLVCVALAACWFALPQSRSVLPVRLTVAGCVVALGMGFGAFAHAYAPRRRPRTRAGARLLAASSLVLIVATLVWWGADLETKYMAITASPPLDRLIGLVRAANDLDRDGYGSLLGEADCAPLDSAIHPGAADKPGDGIDQNCDGRDASLGDLIAPPAGPVVAVPQSFQRDWNFLLITIDATRYDHTTFGGYRDSAKQRDTTPRLAELVARSTSFVSAQSPSAGTMASIPAILTSKYFHSGIALADNLPHGAPPKILPENTTLPEIMKRGNYATGVIGSHDWWNDWGLEQGVDDYDNSIGSTPDAFRVAADQVSNHALAWISRHQSQKWFMWAHYIDPHGRYVAHPDVVDYGTSEPDLYDAEIRWTDQEIGRLLANLERLPSAHDTIIIVTSDHGESMGEHNVPSGTHGVALYRELTHVPLIVYIPDNKPRLIRGAVTNLDIVPTIADLARIDTHDLSFEGKSLVGALFFGLEERDRVVFAETNAPNKQRAAITEHWRLIHYLSTNVTELFDETIDPVEKTNLAPSNPPALAPMKQALDAWMERVLYARDPLFNQAFRQASDVRLRERPVTEVAIADRSLADGKLAIFGIGHDPLKPLYPGATTDVFVYFHVVEPTPISYRFQVVAWPGPSAHEPPASALRSAAHATADGAYPSEHWRKDEYIRERFTITLPQSWNAPALAVALVAYIGSTKVTLLLGALAVAH